MTRKERQDALLLNHPWRLFGQILGAYVVLALVINAFMHPNPGTLTMMERFPIFIPALQICILREKLKQRLGIQEPTTALETFALQRPWAMTALVTLALALFFVFVVTGLPSRQIRSGLIDVLLFTPFLALVSGVSLFGWRAWTLKQNRQKN